MISFFRNCLLFYTRLGYTHIIFFLIKQLNYFQTEMQRQFDHTNSEFTLEKIIEYGFDQFADQINEISGAATKELAIEQVPYLKLKFVQLSLN